MKTFIKLVSISLIIAFILFVIDIVFDYVSNKEVVYNMHLVKVFGYYVLYSFPLTLVNASFFDYLNERVVWDRYKKYRLAIGFFGSIVLTIGTVFLIRMFHRMVLEEVSYETFIETESLSFYYTALIITIAVSLFFHAFYFYQQLQKNKIKEQKVIAGTASAKFDALKNQLDPHFLFNSLNVLTSLIDENPENAQKFTTSLSKVYRYVLEQKNKALVTVDEELEFAKTYMSLLKMRFEDSIVFEIPEKALNPEAKVVPLSLQLLLENAVKHNMVTSSKPLHIKIFESNGLLVVENNLQPKQIVKKSSGVGLDNIRQRYNLLTDKKVNINQQADSFAVAIPMLTKQISVMKTRTKEQFDDSYVRARKHVEEVKEFYYSLISYVIVIPFLVFVNYWTFWEYQWFWWPMLGWGIGLLFHAYKVYVNDGIFGRNWERKKIEEFMRQEEERNRWN
ncbi:2TM domain-containing protein [Pontimicrobium aquaticum]|uniref:Histidine kinase n=1 Tax=Pontimicrobium aquaticum TaxID=2565367 RepID=A0A4U0EWB8_9FLAO|nr:2TM domain-containing protein [Pontimicrobium aquaticum]TJY36205.1 histidine kinase [Pontimicrobium aquaticum]